MRRAGEAGLCGMVCLSLLFGLAHPATGQMNEEASPMWQGDDCGGGSPEVSGLPFSDSGTTASFYSDVLNLDAAGNCAGGGPQFVGTGTGPDVAYEIHVDVTCDLNVHMDPTDTGGGADDLALYVVTDCANLASSCVGVDDAGGIGAAEDVAFTANAGTGYFVIVDGFNGDSGPYDLTITETTSTGCSLISSPPAALEATKTDALIVDVSGDGDANPGDTIRYTILVTVTAGTAAGIMFTDAPDPNTTLVVGSVNPSTGTVVTGNNPGDTSVGVDLGQMPVGRTETVWFNVTVNSPLPDGVTQLVNQGQFKGTNFSPISTNQAVTPVLAPGIEPTKSDELFVDVVGDGDANPGDTIRYTTLITNTAGAATGVTFTDTPDPNTTLVVGSVNPSTGSVTSGNSPGDTSVAVNLGNMPQGRTETVWFDVTVNSPLPGGVTEVVNQGTVGGTNFSSVSTDDPDTPDPGDPTATAVLSPNIQPTKSDELLVDVDGDGNANPGDTIRYTTLITNTAGAATGVMFTDTPDPNTTLVVGSVSPSTGSVTSGNSPGDTSVAVNLGNMPQGRTETVWFDVTVNSPLPGGVTEVVNQGTVGGTNFSPVSTDDPDTPDPGDPTATAVLSRVLTPTVGELGLLLLVGFLAWVALLRLRGRAGG